MKVSIYSFHIIKAGLKNRRRACLAKILLEFPELWSSFYFIERNSCLVRRSIIDTKFQNPLYFCGCFIKDLYQPRP